MSKGREACMQRILEAGCREIRKSGKCTSLKSREKKVWRKKA